MPPPVVLPLDDDDDSGVGNRRSSSSSSFSSRRRRRKRSRARGRGRRGGLPDAASERRGGREKLVLRARRHFCFIQTFFLWRWFVFFCLFVWEIQKKKSHHKGQKKTTKSTRERTVFARFVSRQYFVRANASAYLQNERRSQNSLSFYSVCFSFVGVYRFITKTDTYQRECSFFLISRVYFFHLFLLKKKERQIFLRSFFREVGLQQMPLVRTVLPRSRAAANEKSLIFNHARTF